MQFPHEVSTKQHNVEPNIKFAPFYSSDLIICQGDFKRSVEKKAPDLVPRRSGNLIARFRGEGERIDGQLWQFWGACPSNFDMIDKCRCSALIPASHIFNDQLLGRDASTGDFSYRLARIISFTNKKRLRTFEAKNWQFDPDSSSSGSVGGLRDHAGCLVSASQERRFAKARTR